MHDRPDPRVGPSRAVLVGAESALVVGVVVLMVGTFLPWLRSGSVDRNSYATGGALRRLLDLHGPVDGALRAWPFVGFAAAVSVAAVILHRFVIAGVLAVLAAVGAGAAAVTALSVDGGISTVRVADTGPLITLAGAVVVLVAVAVRSLSQFSPHRRS